MIRATTPAPARGAHPRLEMLCGLASSLVLVVLAGGCDAAGAADPGERCRTIANDRERLACYDGAWGRGAAAAASLPAPPETLPPQLPGRLPEVAAKLATAGTAAHLTAQEPSLNALWELDADHKHGPFRLIPHRANYLLPVRYGTHPNTLPTSPADGRSVDSPLPIRSIEAKFQLSLKSKIWENLIGDNGDLWLAYTQQSNWQVYNQHDGNSAAFRETDYEPEAIFAWRTDADLLGWRLRMANLGFVHQSNGRSLPTSRSWNRVYAQFGLERENYTVLVRPWVRIGENPSRDDNPDIRSYLGWGDVRVAYAKSGYVYSALGRYSPSGRRGAVQLDWAFPIAGALKGYVQVFTGYGESLIDYNHSQTTIGAGVVLVPWQAEPSRADRAEGRAVSDSAREAR